MIGKSPNTTNIYGNTNTGSLTLIGTLISPQVSIGSSLQTITTVGGSLVFTDGVAGAKSLNQLASSSSVWSRVGTVLSPTNVGDSVADVSKLTVGGTAIATLFSGDLVGNVTGNCTGSSGSCTGNAGSATYASALTVANEASDSSCYVLFTTDTAGNLLGKTNASLTFDASSGALTAASLSTGNGAINGGIITSSTQLISDRNSDTPATCPLIDCRRARDGDPTDNISSGDYLGELRFRGYHTDGYYEGAIIRVVANGSLGASDIPSDIIFATSADGSATPTTRLTIDSTGLATFTSGITLAGDITDYEPTNNGNPEFRLGSADAEEVHFQAVYDAGAQTLDYVQFTTDAASAVADKGKYVFNVDGTEVASIADDGFIAASGKGLCAGKIGGNTLLLQAYDTDTGPAYVTFATLTSGGTPTMALSGDVTGVTQAPGDNSTKLATTAYADAVGGAHTHDAYSILPAYASAVAGAGSTKYTGPNTGWNTTEAMAGYWLIPVACTISALYVDAQTAPGGADTSDFYIMKNGAQQTMTCQLSAGATTANTTANPVSLAAGDKVTIQSIHSATAATAAVSMGMKITITSASN